MVSLFTFILRKDFGELTEKKVGRLISVLKGINSYEVTENGILIMPSDIGTLLLNYPQKEIGFTSPSIENLELLYKELEKILNLFDLDFNGEYLITIERIESCNKPVGKASKVFLDHDESINGIGLRILLDMKTDQPKELRIEPNIENFEDLYLFASSQTSSLDEMTFEYISTAITELNDVLISYKNKFLKKGGILE